MAKCVIWSHSEEPSAPTETKVRDGTPQSTRKQQRKPSNHEGVYYTNEPLDMYTRN